MKKTGLQFAVIDRCFTKILDNKVSSIGLTASQARTLASLCVLEEEGYKDISQKILEQIENVSHPAMTSMLRRLEDKGFIKTDTSQKDKRCKVVSTTAKAKKIPDFLEEKDAEALQEMCQALSLDEQKEYERLTLKVYQSIMEKR